MSNYEAKQVIVFRRDLRNKQGQKLRTGKIAAQVAHASLGAYKVADRTDPAFVAWDTGRFAKICLGVDSEQELLTVFDRAKAAGLTAVLIEDAGFTEFDGPTKTCVGIGPAWIDDIDTVTGALTLL